ncbi:S8 family serine peptidase [Nitrospira tepida]|nr:hypothetical protein [Nitrospira tepida]
MARHTAPLMVLAFVTIASCAGMEWIDGPPQAHSQEPAQGRWGTSFIWYDGTNERRVWLDAEQVAELAPDQGSATTLPLGHVLPHSPRGLRLWEVEKGVTPDRLVKELGSGSGRASFSPVLRDAPSPDSPMRLLPGNVIVDLEPSWSQEKVQDWADRHQVEVLARLPIGTNMVVIKTAPGLAALELANKLYRSGEVRAAFPDWWTEKTLK